MDLSSWVAVNNLDIHYDDDKQFLFLPHCATEEAGYKQSRYPHHKSKVIHYVVR